MVFIYLSWAIYLGGLGFFASRGDVLFAVLWLFWLPIVQWAYIRVFPRVSRYLGYGRVDDQQAEAAGHAPIKVTLYTALGCPFCPIVEKRLEALRKEMGFTLEKVDVTLRPNLLTSKGIYSVPVVEVGDRRLTGHTTSNELAEAILAEQNST
jgi:glutaredoxin